MPHGLAYHYLSDFILCCLSLYLQNSSYADPWHAKHTPTSGPLHMPSLCHTLLPDSHFPLTFFKSYLCFIFLQRKFTIFQQIYIIYCYHLSISPPHTKVTEVEILSILFIAASPSVKQRPQHSRLTIGVCWMNVWMNERANGPSVGINQEWEHRWGRKAEEEEMTQKQRGQGNSASPGGLDVTMFSVRKGTNSDVLSKATKGGGRQWEQAWSFKAWSWGQCWLTPCSFNKALAVF